MHKEALAGAPPQRGWVAPGFEEVRAEFDRNFAERGEIGAAVAAYWRGEKVVDLWGGRRTPTGEAEWNEDTMAVVNSTTKGMAAMTMAVANSRGWIDYDAPVAEYWPEFAQNGNGAITVRQVVGHEAGLVGFADPDARLGFAYVMNNMNFQMFDDPREKALRDSVYRSIRRLSG